MLLTKWINNYLSDEYQVDPGYPDHDELASYGWLDWWCDDYKLRNYNREAYNLLEYLLESCNYDNFVIDLCEYEIGFFDEDEGELYEDYHYFSIKLVDNEMDKQVNIFIDDPNSRSKYKYCINGNFSELTPIFSREDLKDSLYDIIL